MLEAGVDDLVVGGEVRVFVATVEVDTVDVKKEAILQEQDVHVDGHKKRKEEQGGRPEKLVKEIHVNYVMKKISRISFHMGFVHSWSDLLF